MGDIMRFIKLFIQNSISKLDILYTYKCDEKLNIQLGMRVKIPFGRGNKPKIGIIVEILEDFQETFNVKEILEILDYEPIVNKDLIQLGFWMVEKYLVGYNQAFAPILPPGDLKVIEKRAYIVDESYIPKDISEEKLLKKIIENSLIEDLDDLEKKIIKNLSTLNIIAIKFKVVSIGGHKTQKMVKLTSNYLDIIKVKKINLKQKQVIEYLEDLGDSVRSDILKDLNISDSPIKTLEKNGLVQIYDGVVERNIFKKSFESKIHILNEDQEKAVKGILSSDKRTSLIHGLTGSGKTEVYLKLTEEIIKENGQVIILVPEIGLTPQMIERFKGRFKDEVSVLHSKLSMGERFDQWQKIKNGEVKIVVGARSAVFAPFSNLKMIIIDEEHDSSYRYHNALRYDTKAVAEKRMIDSSGKVVLGSATPDVISYYKAEKGEYNLFKLEKRAVDGSKLPKVIVSDMREELIAGNMSIFSEKLRFLIQDRLEKDEQIILFLNRRGFSSFVSCRSCGEVIKCDNCDISMTYHKNMDILRCHYCGATKKMTKTCPSCGSKFIKQFGVGTQRVEEETLKLFPEARVLRMDRDTTIAKDSYEEIYDKLKNKEIDILIGTQMLAKGLDVENITLVGVIAADLSLFISDFRANETTFQLLTQVSGRAGRGDIDGEVVIQTYNPENYGIEFSKKANYIDFYKEEISLRKSFNYPPFVDLISIYLSSKNSFIIDKLANKILFEIGKEITNIKVEYTNIVSVPRIKNIYKNKFTLKVSPEATEELTSIIKRVLDNNSKLLEKNEVYSDVEFL